MLTWSFCRIADGEWRDPTVEEPVARIAAMLQDFTDRALVERHALWLLKRDPDAGLRVREPFCLESFDSHCFP